MERVVIADVAHHDHKYERNKIGKRGACPHSSMPNTQRVFPQTPGQLNYSASAYDAAQGAHTLLLLTEWPEFRDLDLARLRSLMEVPVLVDGRNLLDPEAVRQAGFEYFSMGRDGAVASTNRSLHTSRQP